MRPRLLLPACALLLALPLGCAPGAPPPAKQPSRLGEARPDPIVSPSAMGSPNPADDDGTDPVYPGPLTAYRLTTTEKATIDHARAVLVDACMARFGYSYPVRPFAERLAELRANDAQDISRMFGPTDRETARRHGYLTATMTSDERVAESRAAGVRDDDPGWILVLSGDRLGEDGGLEPAAAEGESPGAVDGVAIPAGGCFGEARRTLGEEVQELSYGQLANRYNIEAGDEAWGRPAYRAVVAEWSACMAEGGWKASDPLKPDDSDDQRRLVVRVNEDDPPSAEEIEFALAHIDCAERTNLVSRLQEVTDAVEAEYVEKHQLELQENRARLDEVVARAAKAIEQAGR